MATASKKQSKQTKGRASASTRTSAKALAGKSTKRGTVVTPSAIVEPVAALRPREATKRRSNTRYPITIERFVALKANAASTAAKKPALRGTTIVKDTSTNGKARQTRAAAGPESAAPIGTGNFAGIAATGWLPPDCTMAVGPNHVLESVNSAFAIYNKAGGPALLQQNLDTWFSNVIQQHNVFDPKLIYDQHASRWVLLAVALPQSGVANQNQSWFLISVSQTADPMGQWWNYRLDARLDGNQVTNNWADYPALGVDNAALYITANMFQFDGDFAYAKVRVIPKTGPYAGGALSYVDFVNLKNADGSVAFTVQPCHTFSSPQVEYLVNSIYPSVGGTKNKLTLWSIVGGASSSPVLTKRTISTDSYGLPPDASQKGGNTEIDTGDVRVLNAAFRGGSVWAALTTRRNWGSGNVAAVHWFQLNATSGSLIQQGVYGANSRHYFYPAVLPDTNGNMTMCFSRCSSTEFVSARYTGRKSTDALGKLQNSAALKNGVANYVGLDSRGRNRWGDYTGIAADPSDGKTVWFCNEFVASTNTWATWIGKAKF